jgi:hypothetical protein
MDQYWPRKAFNTSFFLSFYDKSTSPFAHSRFEPKTSSHFQTCIHTIRKNSTPRLEPQTSQSSLGDKSMKISSLTNKTYRFECAESLRQTEANRSKLVLMQQKAIAPRELCHRPLEQPDREICLSPPTHLLVDRSYVPTLFVR